MTLWFVLVDDLMIYNEYRIHDIAYNQILSDLVLKHIVDIKVHINVHIGVYL